MSREIIEKLHHILYGNIPEEQWMLEEQNKVITVEIMPLIERLLAQEREKVRKSLLPFVSHEVSCRWTTPPHNWYEKDIYWQPGKECTCGLRDIIRQLDLTKLDEGGEEKG